MSQLPTCLMIVEGEIVLLDGTSARDELRAFQAKFKIPDGEVMTLMPRRKAQPLVDDADKWRFSCDTRYAIAA